MTVRLEPPGFPWVIARRLAVSERIGGYGFQHRRVRREEEIAWLRSNGINAVLSLLEGNQTLAAYEKAHLIAASEPLPDLNPEGVTRVLKAMSRMLSKSDRVLLVHRDIIDDTLAGVLAGYLVHSGRIEEPIIATALIQEILKRPLGPEARAAIPLPEGA